MTIMTQQRFIVAEVSKNWPIDRRDDEILSERFERVINHNLERGYLLHSWRIAATFDQQRGVLNETIIAVFELAYQTD